MRPESVLERRRAERARLVAVARRFVERLEGTLPLRAAVVFGSVARGDFNPISDIDLLLIVDDAPSDYWARLRALGDVPAEVEPIVWTPSEWRRKCSRGDPITRDAGRDGVWLLGSADTVDEAGD
jgi:predicted nucleotidyltransferase